MISARHRELYQLHYVGKSVQPRPNPWLPRIEAFAEKIDAKSIIDYGCGIARGISRFSKYKVEDFDPGVQGFDFIPPPADLVVSIHALEHVEPEMIAAVLLHMHSLAKKAIFLVISCEHSTKMLPDGSPWHSMVREPRWWKGFLSEFQEVPPLSMREGAEFAAIWRRR